MRRINPAFSLALMALWAGTIGAEEDLLALESSVGGAVAVAPPPYEVDTNQLVPEHRGEGLPVQHIRRQFNVQAGGRPPSPARSPLSGIAQQAGEYMRRISDYFYWFLSGSPPITRKKTNVRKRPQPIRNGVRGKAPIRRQYGPRRQPIKRKSQPLYVRGRQVVALGQTSDEKQ